VKRALPSRPEMLIDGELRRSSTELTYPVRSPIDMTHLAEVPDATSEDVEEAAEAALECSRIWANTPSATRSRLLLDLAGRILNSQEEFAELITAECGKTIASSKAEVKRAYGILLSFAEECKRVYGKVYPTDGSLIVPSETAFDRLVFSCREPYGVVVAIPPYSDPLSSTIYKIAPAMAAGNTVVLKAPPQTPLTTALLAQLVAAANVPKGLLNVLTASGPAPGEQLVKSEKTDFVTFTGTTKSGLMISETAARLNKKVLLEMSGSDPMIITKEADLGKASRDACKARFHNAGQICSATKRIIVHKKVAKQFTKLFVANVRQITVGNPFDPRVVMGPLISEEAVRRVHSLVESSVAEGAELLTGGKKPNSVNPNSKCYYQPTVLGNVKQDMDVAVQELFGPVAPLMEAESDEDSINIANDSSFGLQASIYSNDIRRALTMARELKCGGVMINEPTYMRWENVPFGGEKKSGSGRESSENSLLEMTRPKIINIRMT
jgi:acyl-CoA reductase-like NAD-dependent aldehyde dehydrogenase